MFHQSKNYIQFLLLSKKRHGIHSPFVYEMVISCFMDKRNYPEYEILKNHRQALLNETGTIEITDLGAGSRVLTSPVRNISDITKIAGMKKKRQQLLFRLARYLNCKTALELGTSLGLGTAALALSGEFSKIYTVEGCPNTLKKAQEYFEKFKLNNIQSHQQDFRSFLSENPSENYDLIFLDGDHNGERTLEYFNSLLKHVHNDTVLIFDDIYWSREMMAAWQKIITDERVSVSIDTFQWGMVFFRKEQPKQHFVIRV